MTGPGPQYGQQNGPYGHPPMPLDPGRKPGMGLGLKILIFALVAVPSLALAVFAMVLGSNPLIVVSGILTATSISLVLFSRRWPWLLGGSLVALVGMVLVPHILAVRSFTSTGPEVGLSAYTSSIPGSQVRTLGEDGLSVLGDDGSLLWSRPGVTTVWLVSDTVFVSDGETLTALDSDGHESWSLSEQVNLVAQTDDLVVVERYEETWIWEGRRISDGKVVWTVKGEQPEEVWSAVEYSHGNVTAGLPAVFATGDGPYEVRDAVTGKVVDIPLTGFGWLARDAVVAVERRGGVCTATVTRIDSPDDAVVAGEVDCDLLQPLSTLAVAGETLFIEMNTVVRLDEGSVRTTPVESVFMKARDDAVVSLTTDSLVVADAATGGQLWQLDRDRIDDVQVSTTLVAVTLWGERTSGGPFGYERLKVYDIHTGAILMSVAVEGKNVVVGDGWVIANTIDWDGNETPRLMFVDQ